jgi:hypothetical protein
MTGLPGSTRLQAISHSICDSTNTAEATLEELTSHCSNLQSALEKMHSNVWETILTKPKEKRELMTAKAGRCNFSVGDLAVAVDRQKRNLMLLPR